jgi:hypothetical protein
MRGVGIAGIIALIVAPAITLAASPPKSPRKPVAGTWATDARSEEVSTNFVVAKNRTTVTSLTIGVTSTDINPGCPTGSVTVPGPLELKLYKFPGTRPFWAFGKVEHKKKGQDAFKEAPVRDATLDGQPIKGAKLTLEFDKFKRGGVYVETAAGGFDFSAKCQANLGEVESPST